MGNLGYPYTPTHPGEILKEEIEYRGISQKKLAETDRYFLYMLNENSRTRKRPVTENYGLVFRGCIGNRSRNAYQYADSIQYANSSQRQ